MSNNSNYKSKIQFKQQNCNKPHIYKITNLINNKYYYGVHDGSDTQNYEGSGKLLKQAYEKHGKENFKKEILMWFDTEDEAYEYEAVIVNEKMINKNNPMCYNLCVGGTGGDKYSCLTPEQQAEISQKKSETWDNRSEEEKEATRQKQSEAIIKNWENKSEEEKEEFRQQRRGENNPMFGQNPLANKTEAEMVAISQKKSEAHRNRNAEEKAAIRQKQSEANKGEKNGTYTMFQHPYKFGFIGNALKVSNDIRKNYPNEKQWNQLTKKERQSYLVVLQDDAGLIVN